MRTGVNGSSDRRGAAGKRARVPACISMLALAAFTLTSGYYPASAQIWDKMKEDLASRGIMPSVVYDGNLLTDAAGGLKRDSIFQGNFYAQLRIDISFDVLAVHLHGNTGHNASPLPARTNRRILTACRTGRLVLT